MAHSHLGCFQFVILIRDSIINFTVYVFVDTCSIIPVQLIPGIQRVDTFWRTQRTQTSVFTLSNRPDFHHSFLTNLRLQADDYAQAQGRCSLDDTESVMAPE